MKCVECRQCNIKGKPSVMKGSIYCDNHIKKKTLRKRLGLFSVLKDKIFEKRYNELYNQFKKNGFRESWFK